jgi:hypothetical protein
MDKSRNGQELAKRIERLEIEVRDMKSNLERKINELSCMAGKHEVKTSDVYKDLETYIEALNKKLVRVEFGWQGHLFYVSKDQSYRNHDWNLTVKSNTDVYLSETQRGIIKDFLLIEYKLSFTSISVIT